MNKCILLIIVILVGTCILFSIQGYSKIKENLKNNDTSGNDTSDDDDVSGNGTSTDNISSCLSNVITGMVANAVDANNDDVSNGDNGGDNGDGNGTSNPTGNGVDPSNIRVFDSSTGDGSMIFPGTTVIIFEDGDSANGKDSATASNGDRDSGEYLSSSDPNLSVDGKVPSSPGGFSAMEGYKSNDTNGTNKPNGSTSNKTFANSESSDNITNSSGSTVTKSNSNGDIYNHASYNSWSSPNVSKDWRTNNMFSGYSIPYSHFEQKNAFPLSSVGGYETADVGPLASNVIDYIHTKK